MRLDITCPSGLAGVIDKLEVRHGGVVADDRALRSGKAGNRILQATWKETTDRGPYRVLDGVINWSEVLVPDRMLAFIYARVATYGPTEELDMKCPACRNKFVWELPLLELPVYDIPDEVREQLAKGKNRFEVPDIDGRTVGLKLLTGADSMAIAKIVQEEDLDDMIPAMLRVRILDVDGIEPKQTEDWIGRLSMGETQKIIDAVDELEGGVDTNIEVYCPRAACSYEWEVELPLDLRRMFSPKRAGRRRGGKRRKPRGENLRRPSTDSSDESTPKT